MILRPLAIAGAYLVEHRAALRPPRVLRAVVQRARIQGARPCRDVREAGISYNARRGTVRGMHMQLAPHAQAKLVRCTRGAIYDVIIDLRRESANYGRWVAPGSLHVWQDAALCPGGIRARLSDAGDDVEVSYQLSDDYHPDAECGVRWNDPRFGITWPIADVVVSERDRSFDDFQD